MTKGIACRCPVGHEERCNCSQQCRSSITLHEIKYFTIDTKSAAQVKREMCVSVVLVKTMMYRESFTGIRGVFGPVNTTLFGLKGTATVRGEKFP